jgi:hypothetical protein
VRRFEFPLCFAAIFVESAPASAGDWIEIGIAERLKTHRIMPGDPGFCPACGAKIDFSSGIGLCLKYQLTFSPGVLLKRDSMRMPAAIIFELLWMKRAVEKSLSRTTDRKTNAIPQLLVNTGRHSDGK